MYSVSQFAKQVGVSVKTLQRWDREGRLHAKRTVSGRRYYAEADLATALSLPQRPAARRTVAYCRVSSPAQRPDVQNQRAALEQYAQAKGIAVDQWVLEIGGGLNFERKRFLALIEAIVAGEVKCLVIAHQDRLARFGFALLKHLCETHETELLVMNRETLSPEQELVQDLMSIVHCFSSRLDGLRNYPPSAVVGVDVGIKQAAVVSDGRRLENQKPLASHLKKLGKLQPRLSKKQKARDPETRRTVDSKHYAKHRLKVAREHQEIANSRRDVQHKFTTELARTCGVIGIEDLNLPGMMANRKLARAVADAAMGQRLLFLKTKLANAGGDLFVASRKLTVLGSGYDR